MELSKEVLLILVLLMVVYTGIIFVQQESPTGNVVLEAGVIDVFEQMNLTPFNTTNGISLFPQEMIIQRNFTAYNSTALVSAFEGNSNKTSKVIADDGKEFELDDDDILNVTFTSALFAGDVVTVHSDDSQNKGVQLCTPNGNCNVAMGVFNSTHKTYNFTLTGELGSAFYLSTNDDVDLDAVFGFKKNIFFYNVSNWNYPAASWTSGKFSLPGIATVHGLLINQTLNNQSMKYEYSTDQNTWVVITNPMEKQLQGFWVKVTWYSDGNATPVLFGLQINYTSCIRECFPSNIEINRSAVISLMPNETAFVNASFTGLAIYPGALELDKTLSVVEYDETNKSYEKKPAKRFVDIDANLSTNTSFTLRMFYTDEDLAEGKIEESSLKIHYFNTTSSAWEALDSVVHAEENYVEASLSHLSTYGLFGEEIPETPSSPGGSGGSGGGSSRGKVHEEKPASVEETSTTLLIQKVEQQTQEESAPQEALAPAAAREASTPEFKSITGRFADASKRILKSPQLLLLSGILLVALVYLVRRFFWLRQTSGISGRRRRT